MSLRPGLLAHPHAAALRAALARVQRDGRREERRAARAARAAAERARRAAEDRRAVEAAANRTRVGGVAATAVEDDPGRTIATLHAERPCYVCKRGYRRVHFFYARLCPDCAADSYARRCEVVDLRGRTAVVTGGRIKIGHQVALRLLAWGARVVVTSRFPGDTARRFAADPRFAGFRERLHVHALDLRALPAVEAFAARLVAEHPRIDVLVNNAAQTVRRPPAFYAGLLAAEDRAALPAGLAEAAGALPGGGELFPAGSDDGFGQPLDLRGRNSWRLRLDEVGTVELVEVQLINAVAPFMLVGRLRRAMARPGGAAFVVNVSAPEGRFDRVYKSEFHPHTNMAKAALNMMTRTSAEDFARDGIYMTAVDTGWVSNENPAPVAAAMAAGGFVPPLDLVDAATRVCDPVARGVRDGELLCGVFLKDFRPVSW
jgi:NAD(P)-dependent dehydrogenase (short-subunit alcohol dehydrogenase family)